MSELSSDPPFGPRDDGAPTGSGRWDSRIGSILVQVSGLLEELTPQQWESPSLCEGWRVRDVAGHFVWRVGSSNAQMLRSGLCASVRHGVNPVMAIDLSRAAAKESPQQLVQGIRRIAVDKFAGVGRTGIVELTECVVHAFDIANPLGVDLAIDAETTGAVATTRARLAPAPLRAVLNARTLRAQDAGWRIGRGPVIEGTAQAIVLFLFGREPLRRRITAGA
ncbi:MAG: maleylpyruvate isomerase family mycothiol-dependent enzyme [Microbacteriaceae bacterium]